MDELKMGKKSGWVLGRDAKNKQHLATTKTHDGARAILETFYYAFNQKSMTAFEPVWAPQALIQLNNPLGGIQRGYEPIQALYRRIFEGSAEVWVEFYDIVEYLSADMAVFAGRERGEFKQNDVSVTLNIRTTRVFGYLGAKLGWRQLHHHGSIDDAALLRQYQLAVKGELK